MATGGMSMTSTARFIPRAASAARPELASASLHNAHWAASAGSAAASNRAAAARSEIGKAFFMTTPLPFLLSSPEVDHAEAVREQDHEQAEQDHEGRDYGEHETQALEPQVHEVSHNERGLDDRQPHQDDQHQGEVQVNVGEEDLDGRQKEQ